MQTKFQVGDRVTNAMGTGPMFRAVVVVVYPPSFDGDELHPTQKEHSYGLNNLVSGATMGLYYESQLLPDAAVTCPLVQGTNVVSESNPVCSPVPHNAGVKYDESKADMSLLSPVAINKIALVMTYGAKKYDANNWRKGMNWSRLLAASLRHIMAYLGGEDKDAETGLSHLAHASCCLMMLLEYEETHKALDNRYTKKGA